MVRLPGRNARGSAVNHAARALIMAGGTLAMVVAAAIGLGDTAVITVGLSGFASAALGWRMSRLRPGALQNLYAWSCCVFGATTVGHGYVALSLGVTGARRLEAWLWVAAGLMVICGACTTLLLKPRTRVT